jgi:hypothetical protein
MLFRSNGGEANLYLRAASPVPTVPNSGESGNNLWQRISEPALLGEILASVVLLSAPHYRVD